MSVVTLLNEKIMKNLLVEELAIYTPIEPLRLADGTTSPLQRWLGGVIDLDKIVYVGDAYSRNRDGFYDNGRDNIVSFQITILDGNSIHYNWEVSSTAVSITPEEYEKSPRYPCQKLGTNFYRLEYKSEENVKKCQTVIVDDLVKVWRKYKEENSMKGHVT